MTGVLAIDIGNTTTTLAFWPPESDPLHWQVSSGPHRTRDEYCVLIDRMLRRDGIEPSAVTAVVVACVVPPLSATVSAATEALFGVPPLVVGPGTHTGLSIRTDNPREVGPDRIANAVAAVSGFGMPVLVLDLSTALIIDVVSADGEYIGAIIAPGLGVAADALAKRTAQLMRFRLEAPPRAIAGTTEENLQAGNVLGYLGLVEGLVGRVRAEIGPAPLIATGDEALPDLLSMCKAIDAYEPLLTVTGLRLIHERHTGRQTK